MVLLTNFYKSFIKVCPLIQKSGINTHACTNTHTHTSKSDKTEIYNKITTHIS